MNVKKLTTTMQQFAVRAVYSVALCSAIFSLSGCLEQTNSSSSIVIPPGGLIQLDMSETNKVGQSKYSLYLSEVVEDSADPKNLMDLTASDKPDRLNQILPKGLTTSGTLVVKINMEYRSTLWFALIIPGEVNRPSMETTLTYQLLAKYPNKKISEYSASDIKEITAKIEEFKKRQMQVFAVAENYNPDLVYKFVRNGLSSDIDFLNFIKSKGLEFNYDGDGNVLAEPYPFGIKNREPIIDFKSTTRLLTQSVREMSELAIKVAARDPDGDEIFYAWRLEDAPVIGQASTFKWSPTYEDSRADLYKIDVLVSDGGKTTKVSWDAEVQNLNRRPEFTHNCPASISEDQEVLCDVSYTDPDKEMVIASVDPVDGSNTLFVDDTPAPVTISSKNKIRLRWTPNNNDAYRKQGIISVLLTDESGAINNASIVIAVNDSNVAPILLSGPTPDDPAQAIVEWDVCAKTATDGALSPYKFTVTIRDPNNVAPKPADPQDTVSIVYGGTLRNDITEVSKNVLPNGDTVFTYTWSPIQGRLSGQWTLSLRDNHGGVSSLQTLNLVAQNRNAVPCSSAADQNMSVSIMVPSGITYSFNHTDADGTSITTDQPYIEIFDVGISDLGAPSNYYFLKHTLDTRINQHMVFRRKFFDTAATYRRRDTSFSFRAFPKTGYSTNNVFIAGYIKLVRPAPYDSSLTLPKGLELSTTIPVSGTTEVAHTVLYETAYATQFDAGDAEIWVPISAKNRTSPANTIKEFGAGSTRPGGLPGDLSVTNAAAIGERGAVTISRVTATAALTIPIYTVLRSTPASSPSQSYQHILPAEVIMPVGTTSVTVPVWRRTREIPATQSLSFTAGNPSGVAVVATSIDGLMDWNDTEARRSPTYHGISSWFKVRAIDGAYIAANGINTFIDATSGTPANEGGTLTVTHSAGMMLNGKINIKRSKTTAAWTLPSGTKIRTANYSIYEMVENAVFSSGVNTRSVWVKRINNNGRLSRATLPTPPRDYALSRVIFNESNTAMTLSSNDTIYVNEGSDLTDGYIEFSEATESPIPLNQVHDFWYPKDPYDFSAIAISFPGNLPFSGTGTASIKTCREKGATFAATPCTPCGDVPSVVSYRSFFKSNVCYLRYKYTERDLSEVFPIKLQLTEMVSTAGIDDFNAGTPINNLRFDTFHSVNLIIKEVNDAPKLTNSSFTPIVGNALGNPVVLGSFTENVQTSLPIHILDTDRGSELKKVGLFLHSQVYDLKTSTWKPLPDGMLIKTVSEVDDNNPSPGRGLRTTGNITWNPTDAYSKSLSGSAGFIIKVIIKDSITNPSASLTTEAFYKVTLNNKNSSPSLLPMNAQNKMRIYSDTYFKGQFMVEDADYALPEGQSFSTRTSPCRDLNNAKLLHPTLDVDSADPTTCHANTIFWPSEITTYDLSYQDNNAIALCRSAGSLNPDLAVPKISPDGSATIVNGKSVQKFNIEWCPQKGHIGTHNITLFGVDNGDMDRDGGTEPYLGSSTPAVLEVVSPVYFISPRNDYNDVPVHYMRQTSAGIDSAPFEYEVIVKNTLKNPLYFELLQGPRPCAEPNGMCINSTTGTLTWIPRHPDDVTSTGSGHPIRVKVTDTVTGDFDISSFYLKVQNPLSPVEQSPAISSSLPLANSLTVSEKKTVNFSISAADPNGDDVLHYRWYVNSALVYDEGPNFAFTPSPTDASIDPDGDGPLKYGDFSVQVQVTDGNYTESKTWSLKIRNTSLLGEQIFDLISARQERLPSKIPFDVNWLSEIPISINQSGNVYESLVFSGFYQVDTGLKHFIWDLPVDKGQVVRQSLMKSPWNLIEDLPWLGTTKSERIVSTSTGSGIEIQMTSQPGRAGPFGSTTEALRVPLGDWTANSLSASNKCLGDCPMQLYTSTNYSGSRLTMAYDGSYTFYPSDDRKQLLHDYLSPATVKTDRNFGTELIAGIAQNRSLNRIYVTTHGAGISKIYIFNAASISSGGTLSLITSFNIWDGVTGHQDSKATDVVVDPATGKVMILLAGTGGVGIFTDSGGTPTIGDVTFVGVNELGSSASDVPGAGRKLTYIPSQNILYGVMRESNQAFSIDLSSLEIQITATQAPIDGIYDYSSGMILMVSRSTSKIFFSK